MSRLPKLWGGCAVAALFAMFCVPNRLQAQAQTVLVPPVNAQSPLRILRHTPTDSGTAGSLITVTFNRPVAGMLGNSMDAGKVMSLKPAVRGLFEWRDPVTLRFVPDEPFAPGTRITVMIDTAAVASETRRSATPYTFDVRFPDARPIARLVEGAEPQTVSIGPFPKFEVWYSGPVNLDSAGRDARLEFTRSLYPARSCTRTIKLRAVRQREVPKSESHRYSLAGQSDGDTAANRFRRIVDFEPEDSLPPVCGGYWVFNAMDPRRPNEPSRYYINTFDEFKVLSVTQCPDRAPCESNGIHVAFSAPIAMQAIARLVAISPDIPTPEEIRTGNGRATDVSYPYRLVPRTRYTVTIDTAIRDVYGRSLRGPNVLTVVGQDRIAGVQQQLGLVTVNRDMAVRPAITVRTINVDTLKMLITRIPDSLNAELLSVDRSQRLAFLNRGYEQLQDTFSVRVPVHGVFNTEGNTRVQLPAELFTPTASTFSSIRFSVASRSYPADTEPPPPPPLSVRPLPSTSAQRVGTRAQELPPVRVAERDRYTAPDLGMVLQASNLMAHAKISADEGVAYVTDRRGAPVSNATVELYGSGPQPLSRTVTNADGLAKFPPAQKRAAAVSGARTPRERALDIVRFIKVTRGTDRLIVPTTAQIPLGLANGFAYENFGARGGSPSRVRGTLTSDRDLYRPGDKLFAKVFVRAGIAGLAVAPVGDSVRVSLIPYAYDQYPGRAPGVSLDTVAVWRSILNMFGTASDSMQIPQSARLGSYLLQGEVLTGGTWQIVQTASIRVDEFRAPEFLVAVAGNDSVYYAGDAVPFTLDAKYLFGAPMAGMKVDWSVTSMTVQGPGMSIPGTTGFSFGVEDWGFNAQPSPIFYRTSGVTDNTGRLTLALPTQPGAITKPALLRVAVGVTDLSGQVVTATTSRRLQPSSLYIGARFRGTTSNAPVGTPQVVDVIAVQPSGERVADIPLTALIIARRHVRDTSLNRPYGGWRWATDTVQRLQLVSSREPAVVRFTPLTEGAYEVRLQANDERGRPTVTSIGKWTSMQYAAPPDLNTTTLRVITQQRSDLPFRLGDTARVSFVSPFAHANAWITYEREGVLEQKRISARKGENTVPVVVSSRFAPNIWVGVTLIPRTDGATVSADSLRDVIRAGYTELRVDPTVHLLRVTVIPPALQAAPGDSVTIRVRVQDGNNARNERGAASEVALWAVDQGVLSMTSYETPDILRAIDRILGVGQYLRTSFTTLPWTNPLGRVLPGTNVGIAYDPDGLLAAGARFGGSAASGPVPVSMTQLSVPLRSDFRLTAFFVGSAITDSTGVVTIKAKLPDNITTFRLMASAIGTGARYGSGDAELLVTRRVVVRAALPRFVRYGDSLSANAILNLRAGGSTSTAVSASIAGATLSGDSIQRVVANRVAGAVARFSMLIPERSAADIVRVTLRADDTASGDGDAVATSIPIKPAGTPRAHTMIGTVRDTGTVTMTLPAGIDPSRSTVTFGLGISPVTAMRAHYQRMQAYRYSTSDYVVSAARALLTLWNAERIIGEPIITRDSVQVIAAVQRAVDTLALRLTASGQFRFFSDSPFMLSPWFSASTGSFLLDAQAAGVSIPEGLFTAINRSVQSALHDKSRLPDTITGTPIEREFRYRGYLGSKIEKLRYLRRAGTPDIPAEDELLSRERLLAWEDRVALMEVLYARAELAARVRTTVESLWSAVGVAGRRVEFPDALRDDSWAFPSHIRPATRLLTATAKILPNHPLLGALLETIIQQSATDPGWVWNVPDHAAAIEAMAKFVVAQRGDRQSRIVVRGGGGRIVFARGTRSASSDPIKNDTAGMTLAGLLTSSPAGESTLRVSLRLESDSGAGNVNRNAPLYYAITVHEVPLERPVTPDIAGMVVERWYENFDSGAPIVSAAEGDLVRVRLRLTVPGDRQFVALEDLLPAGLEAVDLSLRTSSELGPFTKPDVIQHVTQQRLGNASPIWQGVLYGSWDNGWFSPWEYKEMRDDRVFYFARQLFSGTYNASYVARATAAGAFVNPPAHAEEMYNAALQGRSSGGTFVVHEKRN